MISSSEEFISLCLSQDPEDLQKTVSEDASLETWVDVIAKYPQKRIDVAQNRSIPDEVLRILALCDDPTVRSIVAQKRRLIAELFPILAQDPDETVRRAIAANQKTPIELVAGLTSDPIESVASVAEYSLRERSRNAKNHH